MFVPIGMANPLILIFGRFSLPGRRRPTHQSSNQPVDQGRGHRQILPQHSPFNLPGRPFVHVANDQTSLLPFLRQFQVASLGRSRLFFVAALIILRDSVAGKSLSRTLDRSMMPSNVRHCDNFTYRL